MKLSETVLYIGEAAKKIPSGQGTLYVMDRPSKDPVLRQDVITGIFDGNSVSNAEVTFSSGWKFSGSLKYLASQQSKKPLVTTFSYVLTGDITSADGTMCMRVDNLSLGRQTNGDMGSLDLVLDKNFEAKLKDRKGEWVDYLVTVDANNDKWKSKAVLKVAPAVYFTGGEIASEPLGKGILTVMDSDNCEGAVFDKIMGYFMGNQVVNATVTFSSGWRFEGGLSYDIKEKWADPYSLEILYTLDGVIYNEKGKQAMTAEKDVFKRIVKESSISLEEFSWNQDIQSSVTDFDKYKDYINENNSALSPAEFVLKDDNNVWSLKVYRASQYPEYHFPSGTVLTVFDDGFALQYPNADYLEIRNSRVKSILKSFPEAILHFGDDDSKIIYTNGDVFEGRYVINDIERDTWVSNNKEKLLELMNPDVYLDEVTLMYINGTFTYVNGKTENWNNGKTDYQQNKINGNYEKAYAALTALEREKRAEQGAALDQKWKAALPELRKKYGRNNVDAVYEYRLNRRTPVELFQDLNRLGLIRLVGPIYSPHLKDTVNEYVIFMTNRETGEEQYSLVLKFVHPFWSSPDWILDSYSTDFSN